MNPSDFDAEAADVAIAHDYLTQRGGAEKVVLALHRAFPSAPVYTTLYEPSLTYPEFGDVEVIPSALNRFGPFRRSHRLALPFLAWASNSVRVPARHTIVSSSGWAHGFRTRGSKIVYCYSPARWLYQTDTYLGSNRLNVQRVALAVLRPWLKRWDKRQAKTATKYFAISTVVQQRIRETYGIESEVLPAPHSVDVSLPQEVVDLGALSQSGEYYLCISRLLPYKNVDVVIRAFNELGLPLVVVGAGPEERKLAVLAKQNVRMLKDLTDAQMRWLYARSAAVVSASYEDFGLTPIEAANYGKPSIVLRWGGFLDTIRENETGVYFDLPDPGLLATAVEFSQSLDWDEQKIRTHAGTFSEEHFARRLKAEIATLDEAGHAGQLDTTPSAAGR
ncbi:glycosyltransferase [Microbacterium sp. cx-55]|uniref:glycosyltransferase n=1 Tax=Microbacterium sp. cx-55 TaxID=2875948 RepID=UPI001CBEC6B1|nr:glycosyltransferase [Microbacterium sp. cx-55]MBZ4486842.1 glycosyltransferase [Microbacterium sp. cx-55]UGB35771.1 glycosyltransferase [Microbacterium sp. cx-55]